MGFFAKVKEKQEAKERITTELSNIQMYGAYKFKKGEELSAFLNCFFKEHPAAKRMCDAICNYETSKWNSWTEKACAQLVANGATCVFAIEAVPTVVVTKEMVLLWYKDQTGFILPAPDFDILYDMRHVHIYENLCPHFTAEQPKEKSIIVNAMVGAMVAGPAGAVVGAIHAADKNAHATPTIKVNYLPSGDPFSTREEFINPYKLRCSEPRITPPDEEYSFYSINLSKCAIFAPQDFLNEISGQPFDAFGKLNEAAKWSWGVETKNDIKSNYPEWVGKREKVVQTLADGIMQLVLVKRNNEYSSLIVQKELQKKGFLFRETLIQSAMCELETAGRIKGFTKSDNTKVFKLL